MRGVETNEMNLLFFFFHPTFDDRICHRTIDDRIYRRKQLSLSHDSVQVFVE